MCCVTTSAHQPWLWKCHISNHNLLRRSQRPILLLNISFWGRLPLLHTLPSCIKRHSRTQIASLVLNSTGSSSPPRLRKGP